MSPHVPKGSAPPPILSSALPQLQQLSDRKDAPLHRKLLISFLPSRYLMSTARMEALWMLPITVTIAYYKDCIEDRMQWGLLDCVFNRNKTLSAHRFMGTDVNTERQLAQPTGRGVACCHGCPPIGAWRVFYAHLEDLVGTFCSSCRYRRASYCLPPCWRRWQRSGWERLTTEL